MNSFTASYDPADNKLRLRAVSRLDSELYERVRGAGFIWAPKQDLFVAPAWTPEREDLLVELCGEIGDEDTSLVQRAEDRADRFEDYQGSRARDATAAREAVSAVADNIPLGQPILVGHHSERHARRDAERIENGMRKAIKMWETAEYWKSRAAGALAHAKYVERKDVRFRRIKGLEADLRVFTESVDESKMFLSLWRAEGLLLAGARKIANYDGISILVEGAKYESIYSLTDRMLRGEEVPKTQLGEEITTALIIARSINAHETADARRARWVAHLNNRLTYERAMLGEAGGIITDKFAIIVGGQVLVGRREHGWSTVLKVNRAAGRINSVLVAKVGVVPIEDVADYRPPTPDQIVAAKAVAKLPPMTNFPPEGPTTVQVRSAVAAHTNNMATVSITQAAWNKMYKDYKGSRVVAETETHGAYRCRTMINNGGLVRAFISDAKVVGPPPKSNEPKPVLPPLERVARERPAPTPVEPVADDKTGKMMAGWTQTLKAGVEVVVADQLFPTPLAVVEEMMLLACIERTHHVLEPSAGTGAIAFPIAATGATLTCVEENWQLSAQLTRKLNCAETNCSVLARDFVEVAPTLEKFDRILMNPPFSGGQDIQHILLARRLLKHDGLLVAICAGGPRQHDKLKPLVDACGGEWRELPSGTFPGTGVRSILLTLTAG